MTGPTPEEVQRKLLDWESCGWNHVISLRKEAADTIAALRERLEAAEAANTILQSGIKQAADMVTEARAREAAAWEAGHKAGAGKGGCGHPCGYDCNGACFTPPTDATAALTARLDAEWNACVDEMLDRCDLFGGQILDGHIRALRRNPKEGV